MTGAFADPITNVAYIRGRLLQPVTIANLGLCIDKHAERGFIGCLLEGATAPDYELEWFIDAGRLTLAVAIDILDSRGCLHRPTNYLNAGDCWRIRETNAEIVAAHIDAVDCWPRADGDPRKELALCVNEATQAILIDHYRDRIKSAWLRRRMLDRSRELQDRAVHPAPLELEELECSV